MYSGNTGHWHVGGPKAHALAFNCSFAALSTASLMLRALLFEHTFERSKHGVQVALATLHRHILMEECFLATRRAAGKSRMPKAFLNTFTAPSGSLCPTFHWVSLESPLPGWKAASDARVLRGSLASAFPPVLHVVCSPAQLGKSGVQLGSSMPWIRDGAGDWLLNRPSGLLAIEQSQS